MLSENEAFLQNISNIMDDVRVKIMQDHPRKILRKFVKSNTRNSANGRTKSNPQRTKRRGN